ncbi:MAG: hypothetical protein CMH27_07430 [Micavibrio sp.]|nr:hypothetical protein [Micavibrio sp.]|tara:strand:- start:9714 stop:10235 length:522 start_codon:yes stop_codon:yes gene_type:complete
MSVNLKNTAAAAGLAMASAFSANAAIQEIDLDQMAYDAAAECIAQNPEGPEACIRAEMVTLTSRHIQDLREQIKQSDFVVPQAQIDTMVCMIQAIPDLAAVHYDIMMKAHDHGVESIISGDQQDYEALTDFLIASMNTSNDCTTQHMPGQPLKDVDAMLYQMDLVRAMILAPE